MSGQSPALTYTTNAIFRCDNFLSLHDKGEAYRYIVIGPEGTWATIVAINGVDRYRFSIVGDATRRRSTTFTEDDIRALHLQARDGPRLRLRNPCRSMRWVRRELVADSYGSGRVLIAGDAAHLTSPTGGFGMNTGIQDAVDLGWKARGAGEGLGRAASDLLRIPTTPSGGRSACATSPKASRPTFAACCRPATRSCPARQSSQPGAAERRRPQGIWRLVSWPPPSCAARVVRQRRDAGLPLRGLAPDRLGPTATPAPPDAGRDPLRADRPSRAHRAPHVWLGGRLRSTLDLYRYRGFVLLRLRATIRRPVRLASSAARAAT